MIRVEVKLDRFGMGTDIETLATVEISNDGTGTLDSGNYNVLCSTPAGEDHRGRVEGHPRLQDSVLTLLRKALEHTGY